MRNFFEKFGCLSTIILIVGIVILCKKVDSLCYITHNPVTYCQKFPNGRHEAKALQKIIHKLKNDNGVYFHETFKNQKRFAAFILPLSHSPEKDTLEVINRKQYERLKRLALEKVFTADFDWEYIEDYVEEKYKPEITAIRKDLERRWGDEASAWQIVCNAMPTCSDKRRLLDYYLELYPEGEHALEANELLVDVLKDEVDELEDVLY